MQHCGTLAKMVARHRDPVDYTLYVGEVGTSMNEWLGQPIELSFTGDIHCIGCGRKTRKSFNQGYCFPCFQSKASCDRCIMSPQLCHYHAGTCREPHWGETHCMQPHVVYIANASGPKVGITRASQVPTRWMDQGAIQAVPLFDVASRYHSGLVEARLKQLMSDRTDWRAMLRNDVEVVDLEGFWRELGEANRLDIDTLRTQSGADTLSVSSDRHVREFNYPVIEYPRKIRSIDAQACREVRGTLLGIKGQYLILDTGVINIRKYTGFVATFSA